MKRLKLDFELLLESFTLQKEGICHEYLDTFSGEIVNIPLEVATIVERNGTGDELEPWQRSLLEDARAVFADSDGRYISIPTINSDFSKKLVNSFIRDAVIDTQLIEKFEKNVLQTNSFDKFKSELYNHPDLIDDWHRYEEQKLKEYICQWLEAFDITAI